MVDRGQRKADSAGGRLRSLSALREDRDVQAGAAVAETRGAVEMDARSSLANQALQRCPGGASCGLLRS